MVLNIVTHPVTTLISFSIGNLSVQVHSFCKDSPLPNLPLPSVTHGYESVCSSSLNYCSCILSGSAPSNLCHLFTVLSEPFYCFTVVVTSQTRVPRCPAGGSCLLDEEKESWLINIIMSFKDVSHFNLLPLPSIPDTSTKNFSPLHRACRALSQLPAFTLLFCKDLSTVLYS